MARGGASPHGRPRDRPDLALALTRETPTSRLAARGRGRRRVRRLAYRVVAGTALVSGDPVGDETEIDDLLAELRRIARASGWRFAVVGASDAHLERYRALGLKPVAIGEEAVLDPREFTLEGRAIRKVRQSVSRLGKAGYSFRIVAADEVTPALEAELEDVS